MFVKWAQKHVIIHTALINVQITPLRPTHFTHIIIIYFYVYYYYKSTCCGVCVLIRGVNIHDFAKNAILGDFAFRT